MVPAATYRGMAAEHRELPTLAAYEIFTQSPADRRSQVRE